MHDALMIFCERPPICASSISGGRTEQLDIIAVFCRVTVSTSDFHQPKCPPIYALSMTISGRRTEQHIVIGFRELAAVD